MKYELTLNRHLINVSAHRKLSFRKFIYTKYFESVELSTRKNFQNQVYISNKQGKVLNLNNYYNFFKYFGKI